MSIKMYLRFFLRVIRCIGVCCRGVPFRVNLFDSFQYCMTESVISKPLIRVSSSPSSVIVKLFMS